MLRFSWLFPVVLSLFLYGPLQAQRRSAISTVVIDAGHGGHDPGAIGLHASEKNINLAIALKLGRLIQRSDMNVHVIYTREKDNFVELYRRAEIANENKADLFICIHCNANDNRQRRGAETYVMGLHKSQANLNIAKLENASILLESDYQSTYNGFDPNADESYIIFSLYQNSNLDQSTELATAIQEQLEKHSGGTIRGVRQAGFMVLYKTTMPSVLVETGYISNPEEEKILMSEQGQDHIASSIFRAFKSFRERVADPSRPRPKPEVMDSAPSGVSAVEPQKKKDSAPAVTSAGEPRKIKDSVPAARKPVKVVKPPAEPAPRTGLSYRVQIAASVDQLAPNDRRLSKFSDIRMYRHGGMYKYTVGDEPTLRAAETILAEAKRKGTADAFVVIFRDGSRIPQEEAARLLKK